MTIDTTVPGDVSQVKAAAEWLDPGLKDAAEASADAGTLIPVGVRSHWYGDSADQYVSILLKVSDASRELSTQAADAAEKLRSYAGQLERMKGDFAAHRDKAAAEGLPVNGMLIGRPVSLVPVCPTSRDDPYWDEWQTFQDQVELYNEIAADVGSWWGELEVWVTENLDGFLNGLPAESNAERILAGLKEVGEELPKVYLGGVQLQWKANASELETRAASLRGDADEFVRGLRSGNPAVRAAAEAANPQGARWAADEAEDLARRFAKGAGMIPFIGHAADAWELGTAMESGDDPSSTGVNIVGGAIGGVAVVGGLALAGVTLPVWGTAVLVGGAAVAVGAGAVWAYESWVPQDIRESIDAGMADAWDATADFAEDAWENTGDFVGDVGHGIGKAWNGVFG